MVSSHQVSPQKLFMHPTCSGHLVLLDCITRIIFGEENKSVSSTLYSLFHSSVNSSILGPNIVLSTLYSNTLSLLSSLNVRHRVSHPHIATSKIIILCLNFYIFVQQTGRRKSAMNASKHSPTSLYNKFLHEWNFDSFRFFQNN